MVAECSLHASNEEKEQDAEDEQPKRVTNVVHRNQTDGNAANTGCKESAGEEDGRGSKRLPDAQSKPSDDHGFNARQYQRPNIRGYDGWGGRIRGSDTRARADGLGLIGWDGRPILGGVWVFEVGQSG